MWMYAAAALVAIAAIGVGVWRAGLAPTPQGNSAERQYRNRTAPFDRRSAVLEPQQRP
jgi:hypothetical protein